MPSDPNQVEAIFLAAAECKDLAKRAAVLDRQCGNDAEVRNRVEALLRVHDDPGSLPRIELAQFRFIDEHSEDFAPGAIIAGRYCLLEEIAEGGMGTVWAAQQIEPVRRQVALKLVKPGMDSRRLLSRFEAELQALARMDHPFIAHVFDGGVTKHGRPFFVMEYVQGVPVTQYCDNSQLSISRRLKLFLDICQAVEHAHQKGIIHRDLKPSNILVYRQDDRDIPKVIDFGLAKTLHEPLGTDAHHTVPGLLMGTPRYMSPEQAEFKGADVDTRTDVYSLGSVLYELLAGKAPLDSTEFSGASWPEMLRRIKQEEPRRPSSRVNDSGELTTLAAARSCQPSQLRRELQGDVDWITLTALEKDRSRRYQTVSELARDIERYLNDWGIEARPPSAVYRFQKFARRNRLTLTAAFLIFTALMIGAIASTVLAIQAQRATRLAEAARADEALHRRDAEQQRLAADQARAAEAVQRKIAVEERNAAEKRRTQAETSFHDSRITIDAYFTSLKANKHLNVPALQPLRKELLGSALSYYRQFVDQHGTDSALEAEVAAAYLRIGELNLAIGSNQQAIDARQQAIQRFERLAPEHPEYLWDVAAAYEHLGRQQLQTGQLVAARASFNRSLSNWQKAAQGHPNKRDCQVNVARAYINLGNLERLLELYSEAETSLRSAFEIFERLEKDEPIQTGYRLFIAGAHYKLGNLQRVTGRSDDAEASLLQAVQIYKQLAEKDKTEPSYVAGIAGATFQLGQVQRSVGHFDVAEKSYTRALELYESLGREDPSNSLCRRSIGSAHFHLGLLESIAGRQTEATRRWNSALAEFESATELGYESAGFYGNQADTLAMLGRWSEAADVLQTAVDSGNFNWRYRHQLALLRWASGDSARHRAACMDLVARRVDQAKPAEASAIVLACLVDKSSVDDWGKILKLAQAAADPRDPVNQALIGAAQYRAGQVEQARQSLEKSLPLLSAAEISAHPRQDYVLAGRILGETVLMLVYGEHVDEDGLDRQARSVEGLIKKLRSTAPLYCDEGDNWRIAFAVLFAERELARVHQPNDR